MSFSRARDRARDPAKKKNQLRVSLSDWVMCNQNPTKYRKTSAEENSVVSPTISIFPGV